MSDVLEAIAIGLALLAVVFSVLALHRAREVRRLIAEAKADIGRGGR
jgi:hypothetical protein